MARVVRGKILSLREEDYAVAAQVAGVKQIALASPPQAEFGGLPHPTILAERPAPRYFAIAPYDVTLP